MNDDLISRISRTCGKHNLSFFEFMFDKTYANKVRRNVNRLKMKPGGLSESVQQLMASHDPYYRVLLRMMLRAFEFVFRYVHTVVVRQLSSSAVTSDAYIIAHAFWLYLLFFWRRNKLILYYYLILYHSLFFYLPKYH